MNTIKPLLLASLLSAGLMAPAAQANETIRVGEPSWPGARIIANVIKVVITDKLGVEAELVPGANAALYAGMDKGRGDVDVHPDVWLPNQQSFTDKYVNENGTVALSEGSYEGVSGFCVPTYMKTEHGINSIYDLATPKAQSLFDSNNDGKGEIWVGAPGWGSTKINQVKVRDYGISDFLEATTEDEAVFYAKISTAIQKNQGAVFYCYNPHFVHALYDVSMLEEPEFKAENYVIVQPDEDAQWFEKSKITTGDQVKTVRVAYSNSLLQRSPEVAALLKRIDLENSAVSAMTYAIVIENRDPAEVAQEWVDNHGDIVDQWLGL
uniref:ABC transporter substrate-binding protein n=1 Tax=Marinobacterium profundum TaxID=1714300 RepID=UPI000A70A467|nr:glycine betaine ABC transporter substrate-binding protein [Marinobacterium profundum]